VCVCALELHNITNSSSYTCACQTTYIYTGLTRTCVAGRMCVLQEGFVCVAGRVCVCCRKNLCDFYTWSDTHMCCRKNVCVAGRICVCCRKNLCDLKITQILHNITNSSSYTCACQTTYIRSHKFFLQHTQILPATHTFFLQHMCVSVYKITQILPATHTNPSCNTHILPATHVRVSI